MNRIYMDNAATTPVRKEVLETMLPYLGEFYGNPSSVYQTAAASKQAVEKARKQVANALGARAEEIYFTAGGTESDNWALIGAAEAFGKQGGHIITRKPHRCFGCNEVYPGGTGMKRESVKDGNTVFTAYLCETCEEVIARTFEYGDEFGQGDLYDGDSDYWNEVNRELQAAKGGEGD